jgi:AraC family transcriptional regulator, regulatory protein of adaptative response / methylphosphotriester-DNA alkyltransferase methyltransferase
MSRAPISQRRATSRRRRALFEAAAEIIRFEYADQLILDGVAARLYTSPRQIQRAFSEAAQTGFRDYLTRVRMERARELLCESWHSVQEIARAVGYREPAQFAKAFRRAYGVSPSELRWEARTANPARSQGASILSLAQAATAGLGFRGESDGHPAGRG